MGRKVRLAVGFVLPVFIVISVYIGFIIYIKDFDLNEPELLSRWIDGLVVIFIAGYSYEGLQSIAYTLLMEYKVRKNYFPENKKIYVIDSGIFGAIAGFLIFIPSIIVVLVFQHNFPPFFTTMISSAAMAVVGAISGVSSGFILWWVTKKFPD